MAHRVEGVNPKILKECREQISLDVATAARKLNITESAIAKMERGERQPTFRQLDKLAKAYQVMSWVFIADELPKQYRLDAVPAFRQFAKENADVFNTHEVKRISTRIVRLREFILELREDMGEPMQRFRPPKIDGDISPEEIAQRVRKWLGASDQAYNMSEWKEFLENRGVFVFVTAKYHEWSRVDRKLLRGLSIYYSTLPIIIINGSDTKKAQLFTLFHELGHLLNRESSLDSWDSHEHKLKQWCDRFASNILILQRESVWQEKQTAPQDSDVNISRDRPKEILNQYGRIYLRTIFQAYHNRDINLHRLIHFTNLKRVADVFELEKKL